MKTGNFFLRSSVIALLATAGTGFSNERPNFLVIVAEDMSPSLGCYGEPHANTPNLDGLARRGVRYTQAFSATGVCATSRSALITGMYPSSIGTQHMRSHIVLPEDIRPFPLYLREAGYFCVNHVKEDYNFTSEADTWDGKTWKDADWTRRAEGQPFLAMIHFPDTHESRLWPESSTRLVDETKLRVDQRHDPKSVSAPEWLPVDEEEVKREWARYQDLVAMMDDQFIGPLLLQLEEEGVADDTIVIFTSDHGAPFPRGKQWITRAGTHVPLLVSVPDKWRGVAGENHPAPGSASERLVGLIDLAPTILSMAGLEIPTHMEGLPFLGPNSETEHETLVFCRDRMDERVDFIRAVTDGRYRYVRNYLPQIPPFPWLTYMEKLETSKTFRRMQATGEVGPFGSFLADHKPAEELYDTRNDPGEVHNLAKNPAHEKTLSRLRTALSEWSITTRDTGFLPEQQLRHAESRAGSIRKFAADDSRYPIETLVTDDPSLQDENATIRYHAAIRSTSAKEIREALETETDSDVRVALAWSLGRVDPGNSDTISVLTEVIQSDQDASRVFALNVLDYLSTSYSSRMPIPLLEAIATREETRETIHECWLAQRILSTLSP